MGEFATKSKTFGNEDQRWIGNGGQPGMAPRSIVLDRSLFDLDNDWPDGFIPSGVKLGKVTATGLYGPYTAAGAGALADATAEQWDLDLDDATSAVFAIAGENVSIAAADTAAQAKTKLLALAVFEDYTTSSITATKPTGTTFRFVFPAGDEVPNPVVGAATGGSTPTVLATVTTEGVPAADTTGGLETFAGHLFATEAYDRNAAASADIAAALFWDGEVVETYLPEDPPDAAAKADVAGHITYVTDVVGES